MHTQAQRRFRERQKSLIGDLRESVSALTRDNEAQSKQIFVLQVCACNDLYLFRSSIRLTSKEPGSSVQAKICCLGHCAVASCVETKHGDGCLARWLTGRG